MELLDRYLGAVRRNLPWERQDDIVAELRANLESQAEEKEEELGRPMTAAEVEAWLKELGPPMMMAARYHAPRYLVGPALFPVYWHVLKLAVFLCTLVYVVVNAVQLGVRAQPGLDDLGGVLLQWPGVVLSTAAWVTAVFAAIEYMARQYPEKCPAIVSSTMNWSPASLPPVQREGKPGSLTAAVAGMIFSVLLLGWLLLIPQHPFLLMGPGVVFFEAHGIVPAPSIWHFYWWVVGLNIFQIAWRSIDLVRGTWRQPVPLRPVAEKTLALIPSLLLLMGPHIYLIFQDGAGDRRGGVMLDQVNHWTFVGVMVVTAISVVQLLADFSRMGMNAQRKRLAQGR